MTTDAYDHGGGNKYRRRAIHGGWLEMDADYFGGGSEPIELVVNGGFDYDGDWSIDGPGSISDGVAMLNGCRIDQSGNYVKGHRCRLTYTFVNNGGDNIVAALGLNAFPGRDTGTHQEDFVLLDSSAGISFIGNLIGTLDNVSVLDYGLVGDGTPIAINGTFDNSDNWTIGEGWSVADGKLVGSGNAPCTYDVPFTAGHYYKITFTLELTSGVVAISMGQIYNIQESGTHTIYCCPSSGEEYLIIDGQLDGTIDDITVEDVTP